MLLWSVKLIKPEKGFIRNVDYKFIMSYSYKRKEQF
jgi:hypothetical protein